MITVTTTPAFTLEEAQRAADEWGANCGPGAIAAIAGLTLEELRPSLGSFEEKGYTNPTLMWEILTRLELQWSKVKVANGGELAIRDWPDFGLLRIQWHGPWMAPGVPRRARYRHTHWIATQRADDDVLWVFDINCMCVGGWVDVHEWCDHVAPWLIRECCPKGDGAWSVCDIIDVQRRFTLEEAQRAAAQQDGPSVQGEAGYG